MITKTTPKGWMLTLLSAIFLLSGLTACSSSSDSEDIGTPVIDVGEVIKNPTKVKQYENTKQFQTDLDALVTYALDIRAMRWCYFYMASKGTESHEPFSATMDEIDTDINCNYWAESTYTVIDGIVENADAYEQALQRLENSDILLRPNASTRGIVSDAADFMGSCRKTQIMGRKSVLTIMRELNWTSDARKLKEIYDGLSSNLKRGYSNATDFWSDFSQGKIDKRANQIFVDIYNYADQDFGDKARDLNITPGKNITVAGAELIEKGANLVIDACPISTEIGYGKDLYGAINATSDLVTKGDVKGFLQNASNNLINYGRDVAKLADKRRNLDIIYWDYGDKFWDYFGKDAATIWMNDVCFSEESTSLVEYGKDEGLIPNLVKTHDKNGQEVFLVVMVDQKTGKTTIGYVFDKDGNVILNPNLPGTKQITVVGKDGKRKTKTVVVPDDKPTEVVVDLDEETLLEDEPENGYLELRPSSYVDELGTSGTYDVWIVTNYMYYSCKTEDDWLSASVASDMNVMKVRIAENDTGKERKGSVTIVATNKDGKVLNRAVFTLRQMPKQQEEGSVWTTPSTLTFNADGGIQELEVGHSFAYSALGCAYGSGLEGWTKISWKETSSGYNIVVDASANNTDQERSGTLVVYAATTKEALDNVLNGGSIDPALVVKTEVLVKQEAPTVGGDIESIDFYVNVAEDESGYSGSYKNHGTLNSTEGTIKTTRKGDGLHVECAQQIDYIRTTLAKIYDITVSFDIDDVNGIASKTAKIMNLKYHSNVQVTYYIDSEVSGRGTDEEAIEVTNIPMSGASTWIGTSAGGVKFSNFVNKGHVDWVDMSPTTYNYTYVEDPANEVQVTINFK